MLLSVNVYSQEKRLALGIGNSAYEHGGPLRNPVNDVDYNCIDAGRILGKMENAANRTNIVILDACRN